MQSYPCTISIAPAKYGNGMYIELADGSKGAVTLPESTYITDYYPGEFRRVNALINGRDDEYEYGYAVTYSMNSPDKLVMFNNRVDCLGSFLLADGNQDFSDILEGHQVSWDNKTGRLKIQPKLFFEK